MPSRLERILRILLLLQTRVPYDAFQLAQEMRVHRRTIFRDIAALRGLGIPIDFDNDSACYSLTARSELNLQGVSVEEMSELLVSACLSAHQGGGSAEATKRVALKLSAQLPQAVQQEIAKLTMRAGHNGEAVGFRGLAAISEAIREHQVIELSELAASGQCRSRRVVPLSLTYCTEGWILVGTDGVGRRVQFQVDGFPLVKSIDSVTPS